MAKTTTSQRKTTGRVMHEFKHGELKSGQGGKGGKVKSRRQAIAIALKESGASKSASGRENKKNLAKSKRKEASGRTYQQEAEGKSHVGARGRKPSSKTTRGKTTKSSSRTKSSAARTRSKSTGGHSRASSTRSKSTGGRTRSSSTRSKSTGGVPPRRARAHIPAPNRERLPQRAPDADRLQACWLKRPEQS